MKQILIRLLVFTTTIIAAQAAGAQITALETPKPVSVAPLPQVQKLARVKEALKGKVDEKKMSAIIALPNDLVLSFSKPGTDKNNLMACYGVVDSLGHSSFFPAAFPKNPKNASLVVNFTPSSDGTYIFDVAINAQVKAPQTATFSFDARQMGFDLYQQPYNSDGHVIYVLQGLKAGQFPYRFLFYTGDLVQWSFQSVTISQLKY